MLKVRALGVGVLSFAVGFLVWWLLYLGVVQTFDNMEPLSDQEETAFKVVYVAVSVISAALAFGLGWLAAKRVRASHVLTICVIFALIAAVTYPIGLYSSVANCSGGTNIESFPFPTGDCD